MEHQLKSLKKKVLLEEPRPYPPALASIDLCEFPVKGGLTILSGETSNKHLEVLISQTQNLLNRVKGSIVSTYLADKSVEANIVYEPPSGFGNINVLDNRGHVIEGERQYKLRETGFGMTGVDSFMDGDLHDIELLLNGVPDAYEAEVSYDDEAIEKILREGGNQPTQLEYPALYATNQKIMDKLSSIDTLTIRLTRFLVYSSKFGVRMDESFILIRPPCSCPMTDAFQESVRIDLPELKKAQFLGTKKDGLKQYFVGEVELNRQIKVPIKINDDLIRLWLKGENSIIIELYSYLSKPGVRNAGIYSEPILFGKASIGFAGLLGTNLLNAMVNIDIDADVLTHSAVMNRIRSLYVGQQIRDPGNKLGILSANISLCSDNVPYDVTGKPAAAIQIFPNIPQPGSSRSSNSEDSTTKDGRNLALTYCPEEVPKAKLMVNGNTSIIGKCTREVGNIQPPQYNRLHTEIAPDVRYFGVGIFKWEWVNSYKLNRLDQCETFDAFSISLQFTLRNVEKIVVPFVETPKDKIHIVGLGQVFALSKFSVDSPPVELSILRKASFAPAAFVARSKTSYPYLEGERFSLILHDIRTLQPCILIDMVYFQGIDKAIVDQQVNNSLDSMIMVKSIQGTTPDVNTEVSDVFNNNCDIVRSSHQSEDSLSHEVAVLGSLNLVGNSIGRLGSAISDNSIMDSFYHENLPEVEISEFTDNSKHQLQQLDHHGSDVVISDRWTSHVWDISIHGSIPTVDSKANNATLGYHLCYALPKLLIPNDYERHSTAVKLKFSDNWIIENTPCFSIWWDCDCSILNSTNRHSFKLPPDFDDLDVGRSLGLNPILGLQLFFVESDANGNLPLQWNPCAEASISMSTMKSMFSSDCIDMLIPLQLKPLRISHLSELELVTLKVSHRSEPILLDIVTAVSGGLSSPDSVPTPLPQANLDVDSAIPLSSQKHESETYSGVEVYTPNVDAGPSISIMLVKVVNLKQEKPNSGKILFLSLEVSDCLQSKQLSKPMYFSELHPFADEIALEEQFLIPCSGNHTEAGSKHIAKSTLILNMYERLPMFPESRIFKDDNDLTYELACYPPQSIRVTDSFLGCAVVDLSVLAIGMPFIEGWYHFIDSFQRSIGQIKVHIQMADILNGDKNLILHTLDVVDHEPESPESRRTLQSDLASCDPSDMRLSYQVDDSLIDIKAMEYEALRQLLIELDETKERLLHGFPMKVEDSVIELDFPNVSQSGPVTNVATNFLIDVAGLESFAPSMVEETHESGQSHSCSSQYSNGIESTSSDQLTHKIFDQYSLAFPILITSLETPFRCTGSSSSSVVCPREHFAEKVCSDDDDDGEIDSFQDSIEEAVKSLSEQNLHEDSYFTTCSDDAEAKTSVQLGHDADGSQECNNSHGDVGNSPPISPHSSFNETVSNQSNSASQFEATLEDADEDEEVSVSIPEEGDVSVVENTRIPLKNNSCDDFNFVYVEDDPVMEVNSLPKAIVASTTVLSIKTDEIEDTEIFAELDCLHIEKNNDLPSCETMKHSINVTDSDFSHVTSTRMNLKPLLHDVCNPTDPLQVISRCSMHDKQDLIMRRCNLQATGKQRLTPKQFPGRQKSFVDAETDRVSRIMMGVFHGTSL